jgi:hypothetical protein
MSRLLKQKLPEWSLDASFGDAILDANSKIAQLIPRLFDHYEPTRGPFPKFWDRLDDWLNNIPEESKQRMLFQLVPHIFFVGPEELDSLYRVAFNANIAHWLIEQEKLSLDAGDTVSRLRSALDRTWICPITDSMRINAFYHLNNLPGRDYRPDWASIAKFADKSKLETFMNVERIERIVLLEDFIGSGCQVRDAIRYAVQLRPRRPILVAPLIICPTGQELLIKYTRIFSHLTYDPVLEIDPAQFVSATPTPAEPPLFAEIRQLVRDYYPLLLKGLSKKERRKMYGPFGFRETGSLIVLWTNCPDNTLPSIHHRSDEWRPLFPRASRL